MKTKKNILLVCKETYAMPMHFLAKLLRKEEANLTAFFFMAHEPLFNAVNYEFFQRNNPDISIYDTKEIGLKCIQDVKNRQVQIDASYMHKIEKHYAAFNNINARFIASQFYSIYYHDLDYHFNLPYEVHLYWLQLYCQRVEQILDEFKPDVIYDCDIAELGRSVLLEIATARKIPYISLEHARFENYWLPTYTQGLTIEKPLLQEYQRLKEQCADDLNKSAGYQYLEDFRRKNGVLASDYKLINTLLKNWNFWYEGWLFFQLAKNTVFSRWKTRRIRGARVPLYVDFRKSNWVNWLIFFRNCWLRWFKSRYFQSVDSEKLKYILVPLHMTPESSTFSKAPLFCTESFLIESISKSVPWDVKILVKEHWSMIGQRPISFYKKLQKIPNVILVSPFQHNDPKKMIQDCIGVLTITGTTALEAAFLGKPSMVFGPTTFTMLSCIKRLTDVTRMKAVVKEWINGQTDIFDHELAAYIEMVFRFGRNLSLKTMLFQYADRETSVWFKLGLNYKRRRGIKRWIYCFFKKDLTLLPPAEEERMAMVEAEKFREILRMGEELFRREQSEHKT